MSSELGWPIISGFDGMVRVGGIELSSVELENGRNVIYPYAITRTTFMSTQNYFSCAYSLISSIGIHTPSRCQEVHPFSSLSNKIRNVFGHHGVRYDSASSRTLGVKLSEYLKRLDKFFPRHVDDSVISEYISDVMYADDSEGLRHKLQFLGLGSSYVDMAVEYILSHKDMVYLGSREGGFSFGDDLMSNLPKTYSVDTCLSTNKTVDRLITDVCYQMSVSISISVGFPCSVYPVHVPDVDPVHLSLYLSSFFSKNPLIHTTMPRTGEYHRLRG